MRDPGEQPREEGELREEDVTAADRLDDRVSEADGLEGIDYVAEGEEFPQVKRPGH